ncbi:carboxylesterase family protein [Rhodococcoides fascians]|uniref:carboxylesterase family protein n=1 Tax=Rhodococcoides fascians TaxID=1828 RepID=UPI00050BE5FB|nr:carboxylesterase family protein [Rhodococcus fascians]
MSAISTTSGHLTVDEVDGIVHARGIAYAVAQRYQDPEPILSPDAELDATTRGPMCCQNPSRLEGVNGPIGNELRQSENCQVLSVTAPSAASELPVMVWFHGGAYVSGGGEASKYDPDPLVRNGVIVVCVTYRLGGFGYLDPTGNGRTNLGLKDQIEAMRWVASNIAAFGGDPANVTIFGQSAGADSVLSMIAADSARGLFHRAIVQSAPNGVTERAAQHTIAQRAFTAHFTSRDLDAATAPAAEVLAGEKTVASAMVDAPATGRMPFHPVAGDDPLPGDLASALEARAAGVELLIGNTKDDAAPFVAMDPRGARLRRWGPLGRMLFSRIVSRATSTMFDIDAVARIWRESGGEVATYRFDWAPESSSLGASHCLELPFLFGGDWSDAPMLNGQRPPARLAAEMQQIWTAFAAQGVAGLPSHSLRFT